jgi:hypothetical protein
MNNILVILNDPPYAAGCGTVQVLSEGTLHADNALAFQ